MPTAFLSSTGADLKAQREAVFNAINRLRGWHCVRMEDFGASHWDVLTYCQDRVAECDLFIGIVGHRFGDHPTRLKESYTQREYAAAKGKPRLMFVSPDDFPIPANLREPKWKMDAQGKFRAVVRKGDQVPDRDFQNPDHLAAQVTAAIRNWEHEQGAALGARAEDAQKYLEYVYQDTAHIEVRGFQTGQPEGYRFPIDQLYTPLTTVLVSEDAPKRKAKEEMAERKPVPLQQALTKDRIVIVGDPGSGKTTFLRRIAFACCQTLLGRQPDAAMELLKLKECPFPILISAASLADFIEKKGKVDKAPATGDAPEWVPYCLEWISKDRGWGLSGAFFTNKLEQEGALLLIDGLDEAPNPQARQDLAKMVKLAVARFGKTKIVVTSRPAAYGGETNIERFTKVDIGPLDDDAVGVFLGNWCRLLYKDQAESARQHLADLQEAIQCRPEISEMAVNAVMLTALAVVHYNERRLPDQRAELYEAVLYWLARASEERHGNVRADWRLGLLAKLALAMHTAPKGKRVEIEPYPAAQAIAPRFRDVPEDERVGAAEAFLGNEELHSGIVVLRNGKLRFWHQTFQEYLAAKAFSEDDAGRERVLIRDGNLYLPDWRETALLLAGVMHRQGVERMDLLVGQILNRLGDHPTLADRARCVGLVSAMLKDLAVTKYRIEDPRWNEHLREVSKIYDREASRTIEFAVRLEAADAVAPNMNEWARIEGGTFWMGAQRTDKKKPNFDSEADDDEAPVRPVAIKTFEMGRFPVTVREYEAFVNAMGPKPEDWNKQLRFPNRPVVNVSWHDAAAYVKWRGCRLPTEAEWEYAARNGDKGTKYPWGNEVPTAARANYAGNGPGHTTPVGLYPDGATLAGVQDMAGNVYEWVADWFGPYGEKAAHEAKVVRGGSWNYGYNPWVLRSAYRSVSVPGSRSNYFGFRCVRDVF